MEAVPLPERACDSVMHIVEFCVCNAFHGTDEIKEALRQDHRWEVIEYGCLGNCGECYLSPYALVNGESVAAETPAQLLRLILQKADEHEAEDAASSRSPDQL